MATPGTRAEDSSDSSDADETLDPLSPLFDPMKALYSRSVNVPVPTARQFNNLAEYENYMQGKDAKTLNTKKDQRPKLPGIIAEKAAEQAKESVRKAALTAKYKGPSEQSKTQMRKQRVTTVLTRMERYGRGPMSLLRRCVQERLRVIVIIRAAVAVKSRCRGYLIAFDKHMNLALMDVDETFLRPVKKEKALMDVDEETFPKPVKKEKALMDVGTFLRSIKQEKTTPGKTSADMTEKPIVKCEKGEHKIGDLRTKLSEKSRTKSNLPSSSTHSASSVRPATPSTIGQDGDFWRLYKPWAEQRCYTSYEIVQRHVNQMFLRGDNVVSIIPDQR